MRPLRKARRRAHYFTLYEALERPPLRIRSYRSMNRLLCSSAPFALLTGCAIFLVAVKPISAPFQSLPPPGMIHKARRPPPSAQPHQPFARPVLSDSRCPFSFPAHPGSNVGPWGLCAGPKANNLCFCRQRFPTGHRRQSVKGTVSSALFDTGRRFALDRFSLRRVGRGSCGVYGQKQGQMCSRWVWGPWPGPCN